MGYEHQFLIKVADYVIKDRDTQHRKLLKNYHMKKNGGTLNPEEVL